MTPNALKLIRADLGLTQAALAEALGCAVRTVEDWEGGRRTPPAMLSLALETVRATGGLGHNAQFDMEERDVRALTGIYARAGAQRITNALMVLNVRGRRRDT